MPAYFLDSSAVVKRYVREAGSDWIAQIMDPVAGNSIYVASIAAVEVVAALARRGRAAGMDATAIRRIIARARRDFDFDLLIVDAEQTLISRAIDLAAKHMLRGYDAVQLAAAMGINEAASAAGLPLTLVSADAELNAAALGEGITVENPNQHS